MTRALVTGSDRRAEAVAAAFAAEGVAVDTATGPEELDRLQPSGITYYVQLPMPVRAEGETLVGRVRSFLAGGLLTRFALVERVLPELTPDAAVVLVSGATPGELPDDRRSRLAFLHVLAHALRAEQGARGVRATVVSGDRSDVELVRFAMHGGVDPSASPVREPGGVAVTSKQYQDWRTEIMAMTERPV